MAMTRAKASQITAKLNTTGSTVRGLDDKLAEFVSVKDFGAVGDGVADDTTAIQNAINHGGLVVFPTGTYKINAITVTNSVEIDLQGSTLKRFTNLDKMITVTGGDKFIIRNGTMDGENLANDRGHLIDYINTAGAVVLEGMTFINNCKFDSVNVPTKSQDTDLVNIQRCASLRVDNCTFRLASRQGISLTGVCAYSSITNSTFEDCYLFGVDFEPNTPSTHMYEEIIVRGCVFKNNGSKDPTAGNNVWDSGGPFLISGPSSLSTQIARNVDFSDNIVVSTDFLNPQASFVEPFMRFDQFLSLNFTGNTIDNIDYVACGRDATTDCAEVVVTGNIFRVTGTQQCYLQCRKTQSTVVNNNVLTLLLCFDGDFTISGNSFTQTANAEGINLASGVATATITGNTFDNKTTCINASAMTGPWSLYGNIARNFTTYFTGRPLKSADEGTWSTSFTVSVPTGTPTNILDLADTKKVGTIVIRDSTRMGGYASFGNFSNGGTNLTYLTGVQNAGYVNSTISLSGNIIQFSHTFGSTRTVTVYVNYLN